MNGEIGEFDRTLKSKSTFASLLAREDLPPGKLGILSNLFTQFLYKFPKIHSFIK